MAVATRRFKVLIEWDPDDRVWVTYVPALNHLSTFGSTREQALQQTRDAILGYLEAAVKEGIPLPQETNSSDIVDLEVSVP